MYCNHCEQAAHQVACVDVGICGKDAEIQALQDLLLNGLKGLACFAYHARRLGKVDGDLDAFVQRALCATSTHTNFDFDHLLEMALECGRHNYRAMEMIDVGHVARFGQPTPTTVFEGTKAGPGILVTGHDLVDLADLLEQSDGEGVNIYTHGEMLPAHSYPTLRAHRHLAGQYGGSWTGQKTEFDRFSGPIVATSDCVLNPRDSYRDRLFTTGATAVAGGHRLKSSDFSPVIQAAKRLAPLPERRMDESTIGFHHAVITDLTEQIVSAVKAGEIKHFYLIGGCDGKDSGREFYTTLARDVPADAIILTLGCIKYRFRSLEYGMVGGLPRLLDMGQCNDAYGAIRVALALAAALDCDVNDLPLTIILPWMGQRAVAILLTLLDLGVKGIHVGPSPPAFLTPKILTTLGDEYGLQWTNGKSFFN